MKVREIEFAAIDFESAGAEPGATDVPVQIGIALLRGLEISPDDFFSSYVATEKAITWRAQKVHGISRRDLENAPSLPDLWPEIKSRLAGRWVVAHGAATERRFLRAFPFHGFGPWVDTVKLARAVLPSLSSHALGDIALACEMGNNLSALHGTFRWHDALSDSVACLAVLRHCILTADLAEQPAEILLDLAGQ